MQNTVSQATLEIELKLYPKWTQHNGKIPIHRVIQTIRSTHKYCTDSLHTVVQCVKNISMNLIYDRSYVLIYI